MIQIYKLCINSTCAGHEELWNYHAYCTFPTYEKAYKYVRRKNWRSLKIALLHSKMPAKQEDIFYNAFMNDDQYVHLLTWFVEKPPLDKISRNLCVHGYDIL